MVHVAETGQASEACVGVAQWLLKGGISFGVKEAQPESELSRFIQRRQGNRREKHDSANAETSADRGFLTNLGDRNYDTLQQRHEIQVLTKLRN